LAAFFTALHHPAPAAGPNTPVHGVPLASRAAVFAQRIKNLAAHRETLDPRLLALCGSRRWRFLLGPNDKTFATNSTACIPTTGKPRLDHLCMHRLGGLRLYRFYDFLEGS
jgi:hypothetical protein